ncbi:hypothetical protein [Bacillus licheniformis]|uniref:hypothetical protein n=1 Tax=Bacillus TaxID=1386 RepID=UPI002DBAC1A2|nr:hypothetical protein [Bacillus licheniformis]MEC0715371.1 hypothetical protein [Bacillus licheniformis]
MSEQQTRLTNLLHKLEDIWVKYNIIICIILGILTGVLSYLNWIVNLKSNGSNIITFASIVIGVMGVFLSLLISLQGSPVFARLNEYYPNLQKKIYTNLRTQIYYALIVVICSIIVNSLPDICNQIVKAVIDGVWFIFIWLMTLGSFYSVKLITDLIVKNFNNPTRNRRQ